MRPMWGTPRNAIVFVLPLYGSCCVQLPLPFDLLLSTWLPCGHRQVLSPSLPTCIFALALLRLEAWRKACAQGIALGIRPSHRHGSPSLQLYDQGTGALAIRKSLLGRRWTCISPFTPCLSFPRGCRVAASNLFAWPAWVASK